MSYETLELEVNADGVCLITLNRESALNSFNLQMSEDIPQAFAEVRDNDAIKAVVFTGKGKAFCAGMDLSREGNVFGLDETLEPSLEDLSDLDDVPPNLRDLGGILSLAIFNCNKPVIAAVNGAAVGVGSTMTLPMDIRLASTEARFGFVFSKIGVSAEACSTWFLPKIVGVAKALDWTITGDIFSAEEALEAGLVKAVYEPEALLDEAMALATRIAKNNSALSIAANRRMMHLNAAMPTPEDAHRIETLGMFYNSRMDGKEGVAAFLEKRKPEFKHHLNELMPKLGI